MGGGDGLPAAAAADEATGWTGPQRACVQRTGGRLGLDAFSARGERSGGWHSGAVGAGTMPA